MTSYTIKEQAGIHGALEWVFNNATKGLRGGPVVVTLGRELRTTEQNNLGWALWTDISKQVEWYGRMMSPTAWKELLSHDWKAQIVVPGISGGFCAIGIETRKMDKREFSELIELTYSFGATHGVSWSDKALKEYEEYSFMDKSVIRQQ